MAGERYIMQLLVPDDTSDIPDIEDENFLPDLHVGNINLENYLLSNDCPLLDNILTQLKVFNSQKWDGQTNEYMYTNLLTDARELKKMCTLKELMIIATELRCYTGRIWYSANLLKAENANIIVSAFGGTKVTNDETSRKKDRVYQLDTLVILASCTLKSETYPVKHLQISLGTLIQCKMKKDWYSNATCPLLAPIPHQNNSLLVKNMEFFCYPEMNAERNQLEPRTFDFTHILTNMRNQILTRGF